MPNLKSATDVSMQTLLDGYLAATETALVTATANTQIQVSSVRLTNNSASSKAVEISQVKNGGSASTANRILNDTLAAKESRNLGRILLNEGDFLSGIAAGAGTDVSVVIDGTVFSSPVAGSTGGVQDDAVGAGTRALAASSINWGHLFGVGANRRGIVGLMASHDQWIDWASYDVLNVSASIDGALTRLVSANVYLNPGQGTGSVHLFDLANPTSGAQTLTADVSDASVGIDMLIGNSLSYFGVGGTSGAVFEQPTSPAALNLAVTSAVDDRVVFCGGFDYIAFPKDFNRNTRYFNGADISGSPADIMVLADADGGPSVSFTTSNSLRHGAVAANLVAA